MNDYIFDEKDVMSVAAIGVKKCEKCGKYVHHELDINIKSHDKYIVCTNCFIVNDITEEVFNTYLIYSKLVPQDLTEITKVWLEIVGIYHEIVVPYTEENDGMESSDFLDGLVNIVKKKMCKSGRYSEIFIDQLARDAFNYFVDKLDEPQSEKYLNNRKEQPELEHKKEKKTINEIMKTDYQKTIYNILNEYERLFTGNYSSLEANISQYSKFMEYYAYDEEISEELYAIRLVKTLCMMYRELQDYQENSPISEEYEIDETYSFEMSVDGLNSFVKFKKGFGIFSGNEMMKTQILLEGFELFLKEIKSKKLTKYNGKKIKYINQIADFIKNKDYQYDEDLALALFIFENYSIFKKYIPDQYYAQSFVEQLKGNSEEE